VGETLLFPFDRRPGLILRLAVIVQPMRKSLLLPEFRLAPGRPRLRLCREGTVLVESVADLLDREPRTGLADGIASR